MTAPAYAPPPPRQTFPAYVVIDVSTTPPTPVTLKMHRADAREHITWSPDAEHLRIRRAKVTLYEK